MAKKSMYIIGDNIISSLGFTAEENYNAVKQGISGVKHYDAGTFDLPEAFMASLIDREKLNAEFAKISSKNGYTDLEKAAILSVFLANNEAQIDLSDGKTIFILSTTKGNVDFLDTRQIDTRQIDTRQIDTRQIDTRLLDTRLLDEKNLVSCVSKSCVYLWHTAGLISGFFGNPNTPMVVSNACISGAAAQIAAMRELQSGNYDHAVVVGVDFLSKFIISGFQSFKALSPVLCRPFDKDRCGLNLGEAAATMIFSQGVEGVRELKELKGVRLIAGAIRNDANHISAPSRTGDGCFRALKYILQDIDINEIAFINAHGTATPYNDSAEVQGLVRAGLEHVPVNSLKPVFGHTLGAAGILESIISTRALEENMILKSMNFDEQDFEKRINIAQKHHFSDKPYFIKMLSGFGGCNAVLLFTKLPLCTDKY